MIDLQTVKGAYNSFEMNYVAILESDNNIADAPTKFKTESNLPDKGLSGNFSHPIPGCILQSKSGKETLSVSLEKSAIVNVISGTIIQTNLDTYNYILAALVAKIFTRLNTQARPYSKTNYPLQ